MQTAGSNICCTVCTSTCVDRPVDVQSFRNLHSLLKTMQTGVSFSQSPSPSPVQVYIMHAYCNSAVSGHGLSKLHSMFGTARSQSGGCHVACGFGSRLLLSRLVSDSPKGICVARSNHQHVLILWQDANAVIVLFVHRDASIGRCLKPTDRLSSQP